jgi:aspartate carbamoyltransferase regulatory subunit
MFPLIQYRLTKTNLQKHVSQNLGLRSAFPVLNSGQVHRQTIVFFSPHKTITIFNHQTVRLSNHLTVSPSDRQTIKLSNHQTISHQTTIIHKTRKPSSYQTFKS